MAKILVLEDDQSSLLLMTEILEKYGYTVIPATDGLEALSVAEREHPDLAIIDVMLPTLNGYQVCERLHSIPEFKTLPVIILTVLNEEQHRIRAVEAGAIDFLNKPFKRVELLTKIKAILSMQRENSFRISFDIVCFTFLQALALRKPELRTRSIRCAYWAERLGKAMGLSTSSLLELRYGILLRDIGYLAMNKDIIEIGYNDDDHPILGAEIAEKFSKPVLSTIIRFHHCTLHCPDYPENLPDDQNNLLHIAMVCTRYDYLIEHCETTSKSKTKRAILIDEKNRGLWPEEELDFLLRLTDGT